MGRYISSQQRRAAMSNTRCATSGQCGRCHVPAAQRGVLPARNIPGVNLVPLPPCGQPVDARAVTPSGATGDGPGVHPGRRVPWVSQQQQQQHLL